LFQSSECCGIVSFRDWEDLWPEAGSLWVPPSCCKDSSKGSTSCVTDTASIPFPGTPSLFIKTETGCVDEINAAAKTPIQHCFVHLLILSVLLALAQVAYFIQLYQQYIPNNNRGSGIGGGQPADDKSGGGLGGVSSSSSGDPSGGDILKGNSLSTTINLPDDGSGSFIIGSGFTSPSSLGSVDGGNQSFSFSAAFDNNGQTTLGQPQVASLSGNGYNNAVNSGSIGSSSLGMDSLQGASSVSAMPPPPPLKIGSAGRVSAGGIFGPSLTLTAVNNAASGVAGTIVGAYQDSAGYGLGAGSSTSSLDSGMMDNDDSDTSGTNKKGKKKKKGKKGSSKNNRDNLQQQQQQDPSDGNDGTVTPDLGPAYNALGGDDDALVGDRLPGGGVSGSNNAKIFGMSRNRRK
jgi:hypothetical protein